MSEDVFDAGVYDVVVYAIRRRERKTRATYDVRWKVGTRPHSRSFAAKAMADGFRTSLLAAVRTGQPFDLVTGMPANLARRAKSPTWWEWMLTFTDAKWSTLAPTSRRSVAESLTTITLAIVPKLESGPLRTDITTVTRGWAANSVRRQRDADPPEDWRDTIRWLERHSPRLEQLEEPDRLRKVLEQLARRLDGEPAAPSTAARRRMVLHNAFELAVEQRLFTMNPLTYVRWRAPRAARAVDPRTVIDHAQATALLEAVARQRNGDRLVAFFACMYYSALRPSEAAELRLSDLLLPKEDTGWGEIRLHRNNPEVSPSWTDAGRRSSRALKHRATGDIRPVPAPPPLVAIIRKHVASYAIAGEDRLFRGPRGGQVSASVYLPVWRAARTAALSPSLERSPLAKRPYDLRHAAVSTWMAAGVDSTLIAAWAGHGVDVLHRVYAHVVRGRHEAAIALLQSALDHDR